MIHLVSVENIDGVACLSRSTEYSAINAIGIFSVLTDWTDRGSSRGLGILSQHGQGYVELSGVPPISAPSELMIGRSLYQRLYPSIYRLPVRF
jgi:hypothetical protein